jgi:TPR repeat protein
LAPEVLNGGTPSEKADVWVLGLSLYETIALQPAFDQFCSNDTLIRVVTSSERRSIPPIALPELARVIESCWEVDPAKRMTIAEIMKTLTDADWALVKGADTKAVKSFLAKFPLDASATKKELLAAIAERDCEIAALKARLTIEEGFRCVVQLQDLARASRAESGRRLPDAPATNEELLAERDRELAERDLRNADLVGQLAERGREIEELKKATVGAPPVGAPGEEDYRRAVQFRDGAPGGAAEAAQLFKRAADSGHVRAQGEFARCLYDGSGVKVDTVAAVHYAEMAAANDDALGRAVLSRCHGEGLGVVSDPKKRAEHAKKAADKGSLHGLAEWGECLVEGEGTEKDEAAGAQLIQQSADGGCIWGFISLGWLLDNGFGVTKDEAAAARWFKVAADRGDAIGQYNYGCSLSKGCGSSQRRTGGGALLEGISGPGLCRWTEQLRLVPGYRSRGAEGRGDGCALLQVGRRSGRWACV